MAVLCEAAENGDDKAVRHLIGMMSSDEVAEFESCRLSELHGGKTPLHLAARNGHYNTVKALVSGLSSNQCAVTNSDNSLVADETALMLAAERGHDKVVELLISVMDKRDLYKEDGCGLTALDYVIRAMDQDSADGLDPSDGHKKIFEMLTTTGGSQEPIIIERLSKIERPAPSITAYQLYLAIGDKFK